VNGFGSNGWYADDTRDSTGTDLVGSLFTHYGKPGQIPTAADDTAIAGQIQFVSGPGGIEALKCDKSTTGTGYSKCTISTVNENPGFATGDWVSTFSATYPTYIEPGSDANIIKIGIQSSLWGTGPGQSQEGSFTALRTGESVWDVILVSAYIPVTTGSWQTVMIGPDDKVWAVYKQAGNNLFIADTTAHSLNELAASTTIATTTGGHQWKDVLFGPGAKVTSFQFGVGSSTTNSITYVDWVETSLLNGGDRIEFLAAGSGPISAPEFPTLFLPATFIIGMLAVILFVRISSSKKN